MARVFVDVCIFGERWFAQCLDELIKSKNVRFAYSPVDKLVDEHERTLTAKRFFKLMGDLGRRDDAPQADVQKHIDFLENNASWAAEKDCDDPHIFGLAFEKPVLFVITRDNDIANCRKCMNKVVNKRYCNFRLICSEANYEEHKHEVLS